MLLAGTGAIGKLVRGLLEQDPRFEVSSAATEPFPRPNGRGAAAGTAAAAAGRCRRRGGLHRCAEAVVRADMLAPRPPERPLHLLDLGVPEQVERRLPAGVVRAGLDELTAEGRRQLRRGAEAEADQLVLRAAAEFARFCGEPEYAEILTAVQEHHQQVLHAEIPHLVRGRLGYLSEDDRARVEADLDGILHHHTSTLFRQIRERCRTGPKSAN